MKIIPFQTIYINNRSFLASPRTIYIYILFIFLVKVTRVKVRVCFICFILETIRSYVEYLMRFIGIRYRDCQIVTETRFYVKGDRKPPWHYRRSA